VQEIRDLMVKELPQRRVRAEGDAFVAVDAREEHITSPQALLHVLKVVQFRRTVSRTQMNEASSRSHLILRLSIESSPAARTEGAAAAPSLSAMLCLVDLAGNEQGGRMGTQGTRAREGAEINKSLLTLGNVMRQLALGMPHVSYRDSVLTQLLKQSLGGSARAVVLCCMSCDASDQNVSRTALTFTLNARKVQSRGVKVRRTCRTTAVARC
jgi:centromeric protein E